MDKLLYTAYLVLMLGSAGVYHVTAHNCADAGNDYPITFIENRDNSGSVGIYAASPFSGANIRVTAPAFTDYTLDEQLVLESDRPGHLPLNNAFINKGMGLDQVGLSVTSDDALFVIQAFNDMSYSCDGFVPLPRHVLGTRYIPLTYWPPYPKSQVGVLAVEDSTEVSFTFQENKGVNVTYGGHSYQGGDTLTVLIDAYQTIEIQDPADLSGTITTSSHPVAVFSGNSGAYVGDFRGDDSFSALVEQMLPVSQWGRVVCVVPFPGRKDTILKITAANAGTEVFLYFSRGDVMQWSAGSDGSTWDINQQVDEQFLYVTADNDIMVAQFASNRLIDGPVLHSVASAMTILPAYKHFKHSYYFTTPFPPDGAPFNNYVLVTAPRDALMTLRLDDDPVSLTGWSAIPGTVPQWDGKAISLATPGVHTMHSTDPDVSFSAVQYGSSTTSQCTYAFPTEFCFHGQTFDNVTAHTQGSTITTTAEPEITETVEITTLTSQTPASDGCVCSSVFVTASSVHKQYVGFYSLHDCKVAGRPVYVSSSGDTYIYYDQSLFGWVFSPGLMSGDQTVFWMESSTQYPFEAQSIWQHNIGDSWRRETSLSLECACGKPTCDRVRIFSDHRANTFAGTFSLVELVSGRPIYVNREAGVGLTFKRDVDCSYWGVSPLTDSNNNWLMYAYDVSPRPNDVRATWKVAKTTGWEDDVTLVILCVD